MKLANPDLLREKYFVANQWLLADSQKTIEVINPYNLESIASVPKCGKEETLRAIDAAANAFADWKHTSSDDRAAILHAWAKRIDENKEDLSRIMTLESGKPINESRAEIDYANSFVTWYAQEATRVYGDVISTPNPNEHILAVREAIGVVASITPWNFPAAMITRKCAPALAAGCPVVIKPAEDTPLSALALVALAEQAGFPKGVINIVTGDPVSIGQALCDSPKVRALSFTGSIPTGQLLMQQCADTVKKVALELGGNAPFIVFEDADLDAAIAGLMAGKFRNAGQVCIAPNRIFVHDHVYDAFVEKLESAIRQHIVLGDGLDEQVTQGPLINKAQWKKVDSIVKTAIKEGADVVLGGKSSDVGALFYEPTILANLHDEMEIAQLEIFGPVAALYRFDSEQDVIKRANETHCGLAAYFFTQNASRITRVSQALEYGIVGANAGRVSMARSPFGGMKFSGIGREGARFGIDEFVEIKNIYLGYVE